MSDKIIRVLLVEDSSTDALVVVDELKHARGTAFAVTHVERLADALEQLKEQRFEVVLLDLGLPDSCGLATFLRVYEAATNIPIVVLSGMSDEVLAVQAVTAGAQDYLVKRHLGEQVLARAIRYAIEREKGEGALRTSELRLRQVIQALPAAIFTCDAEGGVTLFNRAASQLWGREPEAEYNPSGVAWQVSDPNGSPVPFSTSPIAIAIKDGISVREREIVIEHPDGSCRRLMAFSEPNFDLEGKVLGAVNMFVDVTERKQEEKERERFFSLSVDLLCIVGFNGYFLRVNPAFQHTLGFTEEEMCARRMIEFVHPADQMASEAAVARLATGVKTLTFENRCRCKDGSYCWLSWTAARFPEDGTLYAVGRDVTEQKLAQIRMELQLELTSVLADVSSPAGINLKMLETVGERMDWDLGELWMVDRRANVLRCAEIWRPPSAEPSDVVESGRETVFAKGQELPGAVWASGKAEWSLAVGQDTRYLRGEQAMNLGLCGWIGFPVKIGDEILGVVEFFTTAMQIPDSKTVAMLSAVGAQIGIFLERRRLEEQIREAQKLEAVGILAGGIAHDFNNVLSCISGYSELMKLELGDDSRFSDHLAAVLQATKRATDLVRQILAFGRQQELERKPLQLKLVVEEVLGLLRATIPATIEFQISFPPHVSYVFADASQVHQIIMNLCNNAAHAMKDRPGTLTVKLENFDVDQETALTLPALQRGPYVRLSVSDNGCGMDDATMSRMFEPFFTTKARGEGTGLGLSVVHGIMQCHEGAITAFSYPGQGSIFYLYFPAHVNPVPESLAEIVAVPRGRGKRVLFLDDEILLAKMGKLVLEMLGYIVDARVNAREALAAVREHPTEYDLVITDLNMPGMTGTSFAKQVREIRSDLPIILTTGYSASLTPERVQALGIRKLILKPFSIESLGLVVAAVLAESEAD